MIPVTDLLRQYEGLKEELVPAVLEVLAGGRYILGPSVEAFEAEFAAYCGVKHAVAVGSGTEAIRLTLLATGLKPGDEVITVSFTAVPTVAAILAAGGRPILVDIDPLTWVMDVSQVEAAITRHTKALLPVHLFGTPVDMDPLLELASRHRLLVIEDACQAHGSEYRGKRVGGIGHAGCFSFYPTKNLGAQGDGGAVVTNDDALAARIRLLRNHGQRRRFYHVAVSTNSRFDDLQAAILRVKLRHLDQWNARRRHLAEIYRQGLRHLPLRLPVAQPWAQSNHHLFVARVRGRDAFRRRLAALGVGSDVHYPLPVHLQPAYRRLGWQTIHLPLTEDLSREIVTLPLFAEMQEEEVVQVIEAVEVALKAPTARGRSRRPAPAAVAAGEPVD